MDINSKNCNIYLPTLFFYLLFLTYLDEETPKTFVTNKCNKFNRVLIRLNKTDEFPIFYKK